MCLRNSMSSTSSQSDGVRPLLRIAAESACAACLIFALAGNSYPQPGHSVAAKRDDLVAFGTGLGRRLAVAIAGLAVDAGIIDRAEATNIAGEVEH